MGKRIICPICRGNEFDEITENGITILICKCDGSCYSKTNDSWFHLGRKDDDKKKLCANKSNSGKL